MARPSKYTPEEQIERRREAVKQWHKNNKDKVKVHTDKWYSDHPNYQKEYQRKYPKQRRQVDPLYALAQDIRHLIRHSIVNKGTSKTEDILGCSFEHFKQHIESQFESWMTWDNRGGNKVLGPNMTWDLDHIIPVSSAVNEEDIIRLNHYTNLRPLCSYQNRFIKRDKLM